MLREKRDMLSQRAKDRTKRGAVYAVGVLREETKAILEKES